MQNQPAAARTCSLAGSFLLSPEICIHGYAHNVNTVNHNTTQDPDLFQSKLHRTQQGWQVLLFFIYSATSQKSHHSIFSSCRARFELKIAEHFTADLKHTLQGT